MALTWDDIEVLRDKTFFRTPSLQVKTINEANTFVNNVGFCFAFKANRSECPCLWHAAAGQRNPIYPIHTHSDPFIGLVWQAKDILAAEKKIYYGKALKKRPTMISLDFFPDFYFLQKIQNSVLNYMAEYQRGTLSHESKRIMDALSDHSPQITADLKIASQLSHPDKRSVFDKAIAELQQKMYIVKIAEFYDPFTFLWELVENRFAEEIAVSAKLNQSSACKKILKKYFELLWISDIKTIKRLFGWQEYTIQSVIETLVNENFISDSIVIKQEKKLFLGLSSLK